MIICFEKKIQKKVTVHEQGKKKHRRTKSYWQDFVIVEKLARLFVENFSAV